MIDIEWNQAYEAIALDRPRLLKLIRTICHNFSIQVGTVSAAILDDEAMMALNRQFKHKDRTTDCFSFDLSESSEAETPRYFEIIVNGQKAQREAQARGHDPEAELALYLTHTLLHLLGFDDQTPEDAQKMHAQEDEILQRFGYGVVYNRTELDELEG